MKAVYDINLRGLDGKEINLQNFEGKKILIVNVASACGMTPQYAQLQELYDHYNNELVVIGVPCNDFGNQEPGSHEEIAHFCNTNYRIAFPMAEKVRIVKDTHPLFVYLCNKSENGVMDVEIIWNFHKFLLDRQGYLITSFPSSVNPLDDAVLSYMDNQ